MFEAVVFHPTWNDDEQFPTFRVINILRIHVAVTGTNFYLSEEILLLLETRWRFIE